MAQVKNGVPHSTIGEPILTPFEQVNNTGIYQVNCSKGHNSNTIIDNLDFEILFEYGLNAIIDGYYREAVSSLTAALERFYEFFIKTILLESKIDLQAIDTTWKIVANQSERQLGAFIFLYCQTFKNEPILLNTNKEVPFRNSVIHKGYIPTKQEAVEYADKILFLIEDTLIQLKNIYPDATIATFKKYGYNEIAKQKFQEIEDKTGVEQNYACVNIMTTIDVIHGREINTEDGRKGNVEQRIKNIAEMRTLRTLSLRKCEPKK